MKNVEYNDLDKEKYIKWDEENINDFTQLLSSKSDDIDMMKREIDSDCDIKDAVKWFNDFMQENSYKVFGKKRYINERSKKTNKCNNKA